MMQKILKIVFVQSWWVIAFLLLCAILYERGMQKREAQFQQLREQLGVLQIEKQKAMLQQQNLQMHINSQSDLAWVELALMKGLGVCPEDQQKVYFYPAHQSPPTLTQ
jgi:hypothetical protein